MPPPEAISSTRERRLLVLLRRTAALTGDWPRECKVISALSPPLAMTYYGARSLLIGVVVQRLCRS